VAGAIELAILALAILLAIPASVFTIECLVAALPIGASRSKPEDSARPSAVVLIPAHDEADGIAPTISHLRSELGPSDRLVVVADNCTDETANLARTAGAEVFERIDPEKRGKGYALSYGTEKIAADPPEVLVIVDADCRVEPGGIEKLARRAAKSGRPVQADYLLIDEGGGPKSVISSLALLVKNRVRPEAMRRLGLPTFLAGSGMAFPWSVWREAPPAGSWLVEDLLLGLELSLRRHAPIYLPEVRVTSPLPQGEEAALKQRRRWEHGMIATLFDLAPKMLRAGIANRSLDQFALGLDLLVPPLALLVMLNGATFTLALAFAALTGRTAPLLVSASSLTGISFGVLLAWFVYGRERIPFTSLLYVPAYVFWKIPLYLSYAIRGRHGSWERTERTKKP
jgi:cellulose synthase/poly-beta-1,6-N-acetylglucosamine synthase-like glycosyltransferase